MNYKVMLICVCLVGCSDENPQENIPDTQSDEVTGAACPMSPVVVDDVSACLPSAQDYEPRVDNSQNDTWEDCISDSGVYSQIEASVSSIERVAGFDAIADLLWRGDGVPSPADFLDARDIYTLEQGLRTRVMRRFDAHVAAPEEDLSCGDEETYLAYPEYCLGPSTLGPLITNAFIAGLDGQEPLENAARIEAGLTLFLYVSTIKEAHTCIETPKDCDSSWAYYSGGTQRDAPRGLAAMIDALSPETHDRVFDGILALRCWRDLDQEVPAQDHALWSSAVDQIDKALMRGMSILLREKIQRVQCSSGDFQAANQEYAMLVGPYLASLMEDVPALTQIWQDAELDTAEADTVLAESFACP